MSDVPDWIQQLQDLHDLTPEWLQGVGIIEALGNIAYDIGSIAAKLTMLQQRITDLMVMTQEQKNADTDDAQRECG